MYYQYKKYLKIKKIKIGGKILIIFKKKIKFYYNVKN